MSLIKVLIVDQDPVELDVLLKRLQKKGLLVKGSQDAEQAREVMAELSPDVIIIEPWDAVQKKFMDVGYFLESSPSSCIIVLTSLISLDMVEQVMNQGAYDCLFKPCPAEELLIAINRAVDMHL